MRKNYFSFIKIWNMPSKMKPLQKRTVRNNEITKEDEGKKIQNNGHFKNKNK